ncbi:hypothetical protein Bca52824_058992 [Brassica carinata]|uniref:Uncharacterized protein n=1 Tax=Brassica carinata TaxID=52824 RepID=A0A8X7UF43_BRACI|nr:hypothetical protein Bca52824_058992 [Brassica carinata]
MSTTVMSCVVLSAHALASQQEELLSSVSVVLRHQCVPSAEGAGSGPREVGDFIPPIRLLGGSDEVYALHEEVIRVACSLVSFVARKLASLSALNGKKKKKYSRRWCLSSYFSCPFNNSCYHRRHGGNNFGGEADDKCLNQLVETMISGVKKEELMPNHKRNGYGLYAHQTGLNQ